MLADVAMRMMSCVLYSSVVGSDELQWECGVSCCWFYIATRTTSSAWSTSSLVVVVVVAIFDMAHIAMLCDGK
jgi:hypothetical protein